MSSNTESETAEQNDDQHDQQIEQIQLGNPNLPGALTTRKAERKQGFDTTPKPSRDPAEKPHPNEKEREGYNNNKSDNSGNS
jgi:hypothetical protein